MTENITKVTSNHLNNYNFLNYIFYYQVKSSNKRIYNIKNINIWKSIKYLLFAIFLFIIIILHIFKFYNHIHIAMSFNNNYIYPIMVSITSILMNSKNSTFIHLHFIIGNDIDINNISKIISIKKNYSNSDFQFHNVGNIFNEWIHRKKKITYAAFYRSILGEIIKNVNKIIYLDGDTLIYNDLTEMYKLNMKNIYFRGIREIVNDNYETEIDKSKYICDGVMLMNLKLMRKDHVFNIFKKYYFEYYNQGIYYGDQHIINALFKNKIGFLPPKFGMWFINEKDIRNYKELNPLIYSEQEIRESIFKPVIRHIWGNTTNGFLYEKPWLLQNYSKIKVQWNFYAKKTGYYNLICQFYQYACINLNNNISLN